MHFGMAQYVDEPTELWHSNAWGSSIRTCSGEICHTKAGGLIIPGDIVRIRSAALPYKIGRVVFIGRDYRADAAGEVVITLQAIAHRQTILGSFDLDLDDDHEYFVLEDVLVEQPGDAIDQHIVMYLDREFGGNDADADAAFVPNERRYVRRVLNIQQSSVRPLRQLHPTRGELEVHCFGRQRLEDLTATPYKSLPYLLFIDDFGVHRNMYRALKAFYLIPACLEYSERRKLANVFTLTLGPHGASLDDVVEAFHRPIQDLDQGIELDINGEVVKVCAFSITLLGDMPQQADNIGFMRHNARMGCRTCFCPKEERGSLEYDIVGKGRYHWETIEQREYAEAIDNNAARRLFVRETGVRLEPSPIAKLCPALDLIQSRGYDAPHSEWRGLGRILQGFLMSTILSKRGASSYLKAFQNFQFPPGWKRIQSPAYYIWSWSLSEAGRATLLTPLILRSQAKMDWFRLPFIQAAVSTMTIESSPLRAVVKAFGTIARSNTMVGSQRYTDPDVLHEHVVAARRAYQELIACGGRAAKGFRDRDNDSGSEDGNDLLDEVLDVLSDGQSDQEGILNSQRQPDPKANKGKRKGKSTKLEKLAMLPNVHAGLHLAGNVKEYATVMNSNVLTGELKHKTFKSWADAAAPPNLMAYLFAKDVIQQSLRLGLAGAWNHDHPELMSAMQVLDKQCPTLIKSFLPVNEQDLDDAEGFHSVTTDSQHCAAQLSWKGFVLGVDSFRIKATTNLMKLSPQHDFIQHLMAAYRQDYGMQVMDFGVKPLKWHRRIAYSDP